MATISNTPRPGYVWDSTDNVWYPIGVGGHSHGEIPATIVDAKGDLIAATAADTVSRLAVGNNGETLVADSSTSSGLRWQGSMPAGKNVLINGAFDIWQRGTSFASTGGYLADRWTNSSAVSGVTVTRQSTTPANSSQYHMRLTSTGNGSYMNLYQYIETSNASTLWGQTATFSIKMRKNSTSTLTSIAFEVDKSATADAGSGATWTSLGSSTATLASMSTTTWTTYTVTVSVPNDGTANSLRIFLSMNGTETSGGFVEYSEAQLELGSVATQFSRTGGTIQGELAACQRYYVRLGGAHLYESMGGGAFESSTVGVLLFPCPVTLRIAATSVEFSSIYAWDYGAARTITNVAINNSGKNVVNLLLTLTGGTQYRPLRVETNNSLSGYIAVSAEL